MSFNLEINQKYALNNQNMLTNSSQKESGLIFTENSIDNSQKIIEENILSIFGVKQKDQISEIKQPEVVLDKLYKESAQSIDDGVSKLFLTIDVFKKHIPDTSFLLTLIKTKADRLIQTSKTDILSYKNEVNISGFENKDFDENISLFNTKSNAVITEFNAKIIVLNAIADTTPFLVQLQKEGIAQETGLPNLIFNLLDGVSTNKSHYGGLNNVDDINKQFKGRMETLFGRAFTPEKIIKKVKVLKKEKKNLQKELVLAKKQNNEQKIEKYSQLLKANNLSIGILTTLYNQITTVTKRFSQDK